MKTENFDVQGIFFPKDKQSVCTVGAFPQPPRDEPLYDCWDRVTPREPSSSRTSQASTPSHKKYGPLFIRDQTEDALYCVGTVSSCSSSVNYSNAKVGYSSDRQRVTLAGQKVISQWDLREGKCLSKTLLKQPKGDGCYQQAVALSPDGSVCAVIDICSSQEKYQLVDCQRGAVTAQISLREFSVRPECFFTSDSRTFVVWTREQAKFFDARTTKLLCDLKLSFSTTDTAFFVEPHPALMGSIGIPNKSGFDFFDARTSKVTQHLNHPTLAEMTTWNFSPDGKQLWWATPQNQIFWRDLN